MKKYISKSDLSVIIATFILFIAALFFKGITHDLFLEAGVLLVSIKIIMMSYKNNMYNKEILEDLKSIKKELKTIKNEQKNALNDKSYIF